MSTSSSIADVNLAFVAGMAELYLNEPRRLSAEWRAWFDGLGRADLAELAGWEAVAAWEARQAVARGHVPGDADAAAGPGEPSGGWARAEQLRLDWAARELIQEYRSRGHLYASVNPLTGRNGVAAHIDPQAFGLAAEDLDKPVHVEGLPLPAHAPLRQVLDRLEQTWCGTIGFEIMHIESPQERRWLLERIEGSGARAPLDASTERWVLEKLTEANQLELFLGRKFLGAKRFSVEGIESIVPMLHLMIEVLGAQGAQELVLGMAHRGRLSILINVMGQALQDLFAAFKDADAVALLGSGDVKYHMGRSRDLMTRRGDTVHLSLCFNPSHLEFVNPVVEGRVRAKQDRLGAGAERRVVPLLIHGDAAVIGQGIVPETLNMAGLEGYRTGGTIHIVLNNQVGFTTDPSDSRSTRYCTDISKMLGVPVLHVNAEDMSAVAFAAQLAAEYRQTFGRDIFIDLIAYRRHGHNEGDEPRFTQPRMYQVIDQKRGVRDAYRDELVGRRVLDDAADQAMLDEVNGRMEAALEGLSEQTTYPRPSCGEGVWAGYHGGADQAEGDEVPGVPADQLAAWLRQLAQPPPGFSPHRKLVRMLEGRAQIASGEAPVDWAAAEHLAFGSLLAAGHPVRVSGQDVRRGTFAHRHAVLSDEVTGETWTALDGLAAKPGLFRIYNSPLSEAGVLGFEFGYSLDVPEALVIWEAQFGDFANGAQVIIDQFISSTEDKWRRMSGLTMLLPHGFEGQGPEHSSARLERFLQQCAEDNMQVCNPTTPAQIYHLLRRQVLRPLRKPLVIMSPKSLLRHKGVKSTLDDLATGAFQRILPDEVQADPSSVRRVLLCSGRIYYDLVDEREKRGANDVAILRFEQLYPLSVETIRAALEPYEGASFYWVQDEPWNMGAWLHIQARLRAAKGRSFPVNCISRASSSSPATGSNASHRFEQERLLELAFGKNADTLGAVLEEEV